MGNVSSVAMLEMPEIDLSHKTPASIKKFTAKLGEKTSGAYSDSYEEILEHLLGYALENGVISFEYNETGKAYSLQKAVEKFLEALASMGVKYSGSFILSGEGWNELEKYVIEDSVLTVKKATITFP